MVADGRTARAVKKTLQARVLSCVLCEGLRSGELRTQKLKTRLMRTRSLKVLPLKLAVGQYTAVYTTLTARDFFLAYFYPSGPFACIFPKPLPIFSALAVANTWFQKEGP